MKSKSDKEDGKDARFFKEGSIAFDPDPNKKISAMTWR
jgi:hypothetical protein